MSDPKRFLASAGTPFEQRLLEAGASEQIPTDLSQSISSALGLSPLTSLPAPPPIANVGTSSTAVGSWSAAAVKLSAGGLVTAGAVVAGVYLWAGAELAPSRPAASTSVASPAERAAPSASGSPAPALGEPDPAGEAALDAKLPSTAPPQREVLRQRTAAPTVRRSAGDVAAELRLLDGARAAIARGDRRLAMGLLDRYHRDFPQGVLRREAGTLDQAAQRQDAPTNAN